MDVQLIVADWCPQCPQAKKTWSELSREFGFAYEEIEINSEQGRALAARFRIKGVPSVVINGALNAPADAAGAREFITHLSSGAKSGKNLKR